VIYQSQEELDVDINNNKNDEIFAQYNIEHKEMENRARHRSKEEN